MNRKTLATLDQIGDRLLKQRLPESVKVIRAKPRYPSWPAPVRKFVCACGFTLTLKKSGRAEVRHAINLLWLHQAGDARHQRWVMRVRPKVERPPRRRSRALKSKKRRPRSKRKAAR